MCDKLRNVVFSPGGYEFNPNATDREKKEMEEFCKKRKGHFHRWVDDVDTSKDIPYIKTMALVEEAETGQMYVVDYFNLTFNLQEK